MFKSDTLLFRFVLLSESRWYQILHIFSVLICDSYVWRSCIAVTCSWLLWFHKTCSLCLLVLNWNIVMLIGLDTSKVFDPAALAKLEMVCGSFFLFFFWFSNCCWFWFALNWIAKVIGVCLFKGLFCSAWFGWYFLAGMCYCIDGNLLIPYLTWAMLASIR